MLACTYCVATLFAVGACGFSIASNSDPNGVDSGTTDTNRDADVDAMPDALSMGFCVGDFVRICTPQAPPATLTIGNLTIDTSSYAGCLVWPQSSGPDLCVLYAGQITVTGIVIASGGRPLVLAATTDITINGTIDVSSKRGVRDGAAANDPACMTPVPPAGAGAGAGGSLTGTGGIGGGAGGAGGTPGGTFSTFARVMGGCRGGNSTTNNGGSGGGATMLIAGNQIEVSGIIVASGSGGLAGNGGAGGGGSGGFIGFDAPNVHASNRVVANAGGGGGGQGAGGGGSPGTDGRDDTNVANGGSAGLGIGGGAGGNGAADAVRQGEAGSGGATGGGAGGGGAGAIVVFGQPPQSGGTYSPPYSVQP